MWATNGISRKLLPGMQFPEGKLFPSDWHRGDAPSIRCDRRCGRGVRLTVEKSPFHLLTGLGWVVLNADCVNNRISPQLGCLMRVVRTNVPDP